MSWRKVILINTEEEKRANKTDNQNWKTVSISSNNNAHVSLYVKKSYKNKTKQKLPTQ